MELLTRDMMYSYQVNALLHSLYNKDAMLWLQMGLGKTAITLTAITDRQRAGQVQKVLIFGPLRVIQSVWHREARKWEHLKHLRFSIIHGDRAKRRRALFADADIYLCNYESMNWLAEELITQFEARGLPFPFQMVVYDEVTRVKSSTSVRIAGGKRDVRDRRTGKTTPVRREGWRQHIDKFEFRMGLTGSPAPNGYLDLHGQFLAVDGGVRLGPYITHYRDSYFSKGYDGWSYSVTDIGRDFIEAKIADITIKMDAEEFLPDLPKYKTTDLYVDLPPKAYKQYITMENEMFAALEGDKGTVEVFSKASAGIKCLQIANGAIYTHGLVDPEEEATQTRRTDEFEELHSAKLEALEGVIEEANGNPVLVSYAFKSDAARIMKKFKHLKPVNLTQTPSSQTEKVLDKWISGGIKLLIGHPASMGHGIDGLQQAGHIAVWYGPTYNLEHYDQFNARLRRPGQKHMVSIIRILAKGTLDEAVVAALESKATDENALKEAVQNYRKGVSVRQSADEIALRNKTFSFI